MENIFTSSPKKLPDTLRIFQRIAKARGWKSAHFIRGSKESYVFATRPDGRELRFCSCATPEASYFAGTLADDKFATYEFLKTIDIPQPETVALSKDHYQDELKALLDRHHSIVIKPADGAHGNDVFVDVTEYAEALRINDYVYSRNPDSNILASEQVFSDQPETRIICIDGKFIAAFARIPAQVTGDGTHTVKELIKIENSTIRTAPYRSDLAYIDEISADDYVKKHHLAELVPGPGEKVQVVGACNVGKGGTLLDISATINRKQRAEAEKIAAAFELPVIGIDYFGEYVIEVNSTPSLYYPPGPAAELCVEKWIKYLESI